MVLRSCKSFFLMIYIDEKKQFEAELKTPEKIHKLLRTAASAVYFFFFLILHVPNETSRRRLPKTKKKEENSPLSLKVWGRNRPPPPRASTSCTRSPTCTQQRCWWSWCSGQRRSFRISHEEEEEDISSAQMHVERAHAP